MPAILLERAVGGNAFLDQAIEEAIAEFAWIGAALEPRAVGVQRMR